MEIENTAKESKETITELPAVIRTQRTTQKILSVCFFESVSAETEKQRADAHERCEKQKSRERLAEDTRTQLL